MTQAAHRSPYNLHNLPPDLTDKVLLVLSIRELSSTLLCCKSLCDGVLRRLSSTVTTNIHQLDDHKSPPEVICSFLAQVLPRLDLIETLDLSRSTVTDDLFLQLSSSTTDAALHGRRFGSLSTLTLVACKHITDDGVQHAAAAFPALRCVDLTYSSGTSYASVIYLRAHCPSIQIIRRLPEWLEGRFECPWGEVHTYYADGAFEFTREEESRGFVRTLEEQDGYVEDSLQYINQPQWWPLLYRPGVLLRQIPEEPHQVLVAQRIQSLEALRGFPVLSSPSQPAVGTTVVLEEQQAMVSRMQVRPFGSEEARMPPRDLQLQILAYLSQL